VHIREMELEVETKLTEILVIQRFPEYCQGIETLVYTSHEDGAA
jgi:hypothetical protein